MNNVLIIMKSEWWSYRKQLIAHLFCFIFIPVLIFMFIGLPLYKVIHSVDSLNYINWITPGIWIVSAGLVAFINGFSSMRKLRFSSGIMQTYLKSPISIWDILIGISIWAFALGMIQLIVAFIVIGVVNHQFYTFGTDLLLLIQILPIVVFMSVFGTTLGCWVKGLQSQTIISIMVFLIFSLGMGCLIPLQFYPEILSNLMRGIPFVQVIEGAQYLIRLESGNILGGIMTLILSAIIFVLNGIFSIKLFRK